MNTLFDRQARSDPARQSKQDRIRTPQSGTFGAEKSWKTRGFPLGRVPRGLVDGAGLALGERSAVRDPIVMTPDTVRSLLITSAVLLTLLAHAATVSYGQNVISDKTPSTIERTSLDSAPAEGHRVRPTVPGPPPVVAQDPRVLFITASDCNQCDRDLAKLRRPGGDFEAMRTRGWRIGTGNYNHVQIVQRDEVSELIRESNIHEYPAVVCISGGKVLRGFKSGCTTPLDAWTFGWLLSGKNERPAGFVAEPARVESTGSYRLRGNHWSVDGDWNPTRATVLTHLRSPSHGYQVAASYQLESWSHEELRSLHDDLHERELAMNPPPRSAVGNTGADNFSAGRKIMGR